MYFLGTSEDDTFAGGIEDDTALGGGGDDTLSGGAGKDVLDGGGGNDMLTGGVGDDTYYVDATADIVMEASGEGTDTVFASQSYSLVGRAVEIAILTGAGNISLTGNSLSNRLTGNSGSNRLDGAAGNDRLDGGGGADLMYGGAGNDTFYVDHAGDLVEEAHFEGHDTLYSTVSYSLFGRAVETAILTGTANIDINGNSLANQLTGNGGNNLIDGATGNDTMSGGSGNDTYIVNAAGDLVVDTGGIDSVRAGVDYVLGGTLENLELTGTGALNGTGNAKANILIGNAGANLLMGGDAPDRLDGGGGADTLNGGWGVDTFVIDNAGDVIVDNQNYNKVESYISHTLGQFFTHLTLIGGDNVDATGNTTANTLTGNSGDNILSGKGGDDVLTGGAGADIFVFERFNKRDILKDFSAAEGDQIDLSDYTHGVANALLVSQGAGHVMIVFDSNNYVTVENATRDDVLNQIIW